MGFSCAKVFKNCVLFIAVALAISSGIMTIYGGVTIFAVRRSGAIRDGTIGVVGRHTTLKYPDWLNASPGQEYNLLSGFMSCHDEVESYIDRLEESSPSKLTGRTKVLIRNAKYPACTASQSPYMGAAIVAGTFMFVTLISILVSTCKGTRGAFLTTNFLLAATFAIYLVAVYMVFARTNDTSSKFLWMDCGSYSGNTVLRRELLDRAGFVCMRERDTADRSIFPLGEDGQQRDRVQTLLKWGSSLAVFLAGIITGLISIVLFVGAAAWSFHRARGHNERRPSAEMPLTGTSNAGTYSGATPSAGGMQASPIQYTMA